MSGERRLRSSVIQASVNGIGALFVGTRRYHHFSADTGIGIGATLVKSKSKKKRNTVSIQHRLLV